MACGDDEFSDLLGSRDPLEMPREATVFAVTHSTNIRTEIRVAEIAFAFAFLAFTFLAFTFAFLAFVAWFGGGFPRVALLKKNAPSQSCDTPPSTPS